MRKSKDQYFMDLAGMVATRSTCLRRKIGSVIVRNSHVLSVGYNGPPTDFPHCITCVRASVPSGERSELCFAAHAEQNAINFSARHGIAISGSTLYTTHFPCSWCAKSIVNAGIVEVVYQEDYPDQLAKEILKLIDVRAIC